MSVCNRQDEKFSAKSLIFFNFLMFVPLDRVCDASLVQFPFKSVLGAFVASATGCVLVLKMCIFCFDVSMQFLMGVHHFMPFFGL